MTSHLVVVVNSQSCWLWSRKVLGYSRKTISKRHHRSAKRHLLITGKLPWLISREVVLSLRYNRCSKLVGWIQLCKWSSSQPLFQKLSTSRWDLPRRPRLQKKRIPTQLHILCPINFWTWKNVQKPVEFQSENCAHKQKIGRTSMRSKMSKVTLSCYHGSEKKRRALVMSVPILFTGERNVNTTKYQPWVWTKRLAQIVQWTTR